MRLRDILVSPPIWLADQTNTITITWSLSSARAWWEMTWKARPDPSVGKWWDDHSDLVVERSRSVAAAPDDVEELCNV
jgi:hypothetical protein